MAEKPTVPGYELDEFLGRGAFGEVWGATQAATGQKVAVKVLRRISGGESKELDQLVSVADHPNIVSVVDADLSHDPPYLVTPRLSGSLADHAGKAGREQVERWFEQTVAALRFIHDSGVVHCDLKPANILLDQEGNARLVDFGQAQRANAPSRTLGSFYYMPPEQAGVLRDPELRASPCWDVYALGSSFYEVLTGAPPRSSEANRRKLSERRETAERLEYYQNLLTRVPLIPVREQEPGIDTELGAIIDHCLALDPAVRYTDAREVFEELARRGQGFPLVARPRTAAYLASRFIVRRPIVSLLIVLVPLVGMLLVPWLRATLTIVWWSVRWVLLLALLGGLVGGAVAATTARFTRALPVPLALTLGLLPLASCTVTGLLLWGICLVGVWIWQTDRR